MIYFKNNYHRFEEVDTGTIRADVVIDSSGASKGAKEADNAFKKVETSYKNMNNTLKKSTSGFTNIQRSMGATKRVLNKQISDLKTQLQELSNSKFATPNLADKLKALSERDAIKAKYSLGGKTTEKELLSLTAEKSKLEQMITNEKIKQEKVSARLQATEGKQVSQKTFETKYTTIEGSPEATMAFREQYDALLKNLSVEQRESVTKKLMADANKAAVNSTVELVKELKAEYTAGMQVKTPIDKLRNSLYELNKVQGAVSSSLRGFIMKLQSFAVTYRIISGFFGRLIRGMYNMFQSAASYEEALNLYTVALGDYAEDATKWANIISEALYLDPKDIMQYTGALYNLTKGLGVTSDAAYLMATNLTQLAYDMSSYLNIDVQSAYDKIQSAIVGQSRAVASAGIAMQLASLQEMVDNIDFGKLKVDLSDVALQQLLLSNNIKINVSDLDQAGKTYLRYIQIIRSTKKMQGDLGRTIVTPENALRVLKQQFEMLGRAIGQVFIPIIMTAIPYIMILTQALRGLANWLSKLTGYKIADIDYSKTNTGLEEMQNKLKNVDKSAKGASNSINHMLAPFDELNVVESESKSSGSSGPDTDYGKIFEPLLEGYDMLQYLTDEFNKKLDTAKQNLLKIAPLVAGIGVLFGTWTIGVSTAKAIIFISDLAKAISGLTGAEVTISSIGGALGAIAPVAAIAAALIAQIAYGIYHFKKGLDEIKNDDAFSKITGWLDIIGGALSFAGLGVAIIGVSNLIKLVKKLIDHFTDADSSVNKLFTSIKNKFTTIYNTVTNKLSEGKNWVENNIFNPLVEKLTPIFNVIKESLNLIVIVIKDIGSAIKSILMPIIDGMWNTLKGLFEFVFHYAETVFNIWKTVITTIGDIIGKVVEITWAIIKTNIDNVKDAVKKVVDFIEPKVKAIASFIYDYIIEPVGRWISDAIKTGIEKINGFIVKVKDFYNDHLSGIVTGIGKFIGKIIDTVSTLGSKIGSAFKGAIFTVLNTVVSTVETVMNKVVDKLNWCIKYLNMVIPDKYAVSKMDKVSLPRFDGGGYVDEQLRSADIFAMNENGRAEYLTSIGNRTAVVNQDQMVAALSNVLISALSSAPIYNQRGTTVVNIGNKKVYEGQGNYQDRQADRYGVTYLNI